MSSYSSAPSLLEREDCALVVIDIQEKLLRVVADKEAMAANALKLLKFARIIDLPAVVTEQIKLGPTVPEMAAELPAVEPVSKAVFDSFACPGFTAALGRLKPKALLIIGLEAHICVAQTALSGLKDYAVHVVSDAVSSRSRRDRRVAVERMRQAGVVVSSTEMVIYELLKRADTAEFKAALRLAK